MKFIQDKLSEQRRTNLTEYNNNYPVRLALELTNASANPGTCSIAYHMKESSNEDVLEDRDVVVPLKDIPKVFVQPYTEHERQATGHTEDRDWNSHYRVSPPVFVLELQQTPYPLGVSFSDETLAKRVAAAVQHAVAVCGDARPSLDETIDFIRDKLLAKGKVSWQTIGSRGDQRFGTNSSEEVTKVYWEAQSCKFTYHLQWTDSDSGAGIYGDDYSFGLWEVKALVVNSANGESGSGISYSRESTFPPVYILGVQGPAIRARALQLTFVDAAMAGRVAKAIAYAVGVCGGSAPVQTGAGVTLPQARRDSGPSLTETLASIQSTLNGLGKIGYINANHNLPGGVLYFYIEAEFGLSVINPDHCKLSYQSKAGIQNPETVQISLRDVREVSAGPAEASKQAIAAIDQQLGSNPNRPYATTIVSMLIGPNGLSSVPFRSKVAADSFADQMRHAVELCGGGDPF